MDRQEHKTIAQTSLRTHWSRYMQEAASGKCLLRVKDQADQPFLVLCQKDDAPQINVTIKAVEAREKLSDIFAQVKAGVTFRVVNKKGKEVYLRPFRRYRYPLAEPVKKFWEEKVSSELRSADRTEDLVHLIKSNNESMEAKVEKITKLVRHVIRESHGLKTYTPEQLARDADGCDEI